MSETENFPKWFLAWVNDLKREELYELIYNRMSEEEKQEAKSDYKELEWDTDNESEESEESEEENNPEFCQLCKQVRENRIAGNCDGNGKGDCPHNVENMCFGCGEWYEEEMVWRCLDCANTYGFPKDEEDQN